MCYLARAHRDPQTGAVTICFSLTDEEIAAIDKTKALLIRVTTYGDPMQPINLWVEDENGKAIYDERIK